MNHQFEQNTNNNKFAHTYSSVIPVSSASGLHVNVSLWNTNNDTNAFKDANDQQLGVSNIAYHFLGGLLEHAASSCAVMCPTVNSYKR